MPSLEGRLLRVGFRGLKFWVTLRLTVRGVTKSTVTMSVNVTIVTKQNIVIGLNKQVKLLVNNVVVVPLVRPKALPCLAWWAKVCGLATFSETVETVGVNVDVVIVSSVRASVI